MLKATYLVQLGLVGALAIPALHDRDASLRGALAETERALETLLSLKTAVNAEDASLVQEALRFSEPAMEDPQRADRLLDELRHDVGRLQQELDELEVQGYLALAAPHPARGAASASAADPNDDPVAWRPPIGLDDEQHERLRTGALATDSGPRTARAAQTERRALEAPGFSADPVRHGRALFRAGHYTQGVGLLERYQGVGEADYWRARCLERLQRLDEALHLFEKIVEAHPESDLGRRAARDLDFVAWQVSFERRLGERRKP